jgi:hypothetical protein
MIIPYRPFGTMAVPYRRVWKYSSSLPTCLEIFQFLTTFLEIPVPYRRVWKYSSSLRRFWKFQFLTDVSRNCSSLPTFRDKGNSLPTFRDIRSYLPTFRTMVIDGYPKKLPLSLCNKTEERCSYLLCGESLIRREPNEMSGDCRSHQEQEVL